MVRRDGTIETGRPLEQVGAHCLYHNRHSIGICYEGGLDAAGKAADTRTEAQKRSLRELVERLHEQFPKLSSSVIMIWIQLSPVRALRW